MPGLTDGLTCTILIAVIYLARQLINRSSRPTDQSFDQIDGLFATICCLLLGLNFGWLYALILATAIGYLHVALFIHQLSYLARRLQALDVDE